MTMNNCNKKVTLPVHHITVDDDRYFDRNIVEQHFRVIFTGYTEHHAILDNHAPSILASKEEAEPMFSTSIKKVLKRKIK